MQRRFPNQCPSCASNLDVTELTCQSCGTVVKGHFPTSGLWKLRAEQLEFVETFLRLRGNIREVERDLGISYPTVRSRLEQINRDMGYTAAPDTESGEPMTQDALTAFEQGELSFDEVLARIQKG